MSNWDALNVQFAWFVPDVGIFRVANVFEALLGVEPDTVQTSKAPSPASPFLALAASVLNDEHHQVTFQPGRIDYSVNPVAGPTNIAPPAFADTEAVFAAALARVCGWSVSPALRLAIIMNVLRPCDSLEDAADLVNAKIGNPVTFQGALDLMFQLNRRKKIDDSIEMNRLLRFAVASFQSMNLTINFNGPVSVVGESFSGALYLDVNTVLDERSKPLLTLEPIWRALSEELVRLRLDGSIRALET